MSVSRVALSFKIMFLLHLGSCLFVPIILLIHWLLSLNVKIPVPHSSTPYMLIRLHSGPLQHFITAEPQQHVRMEEYW